MHEYRVLPFYFKLFIILGATGQPGGVGETPDALHQVVEAATRAAVGESNPAFASSLSDAMKNLTTNPELDVNLLAVIYRRNIYTLVI